MAKNEKPLPRLRGNPLQEGIEEIGLPNPALEGESTKDIAFFALGYIQELAARVKQHCSDVKLTGFEKREDCELLVSLVLKATKLVRDLALEFRTLFQEIAEQSAAFPVSFPAHPESLRRLQKVLWDDFNLGKRHELKLRPAPGRKTFSFDTLVNQLLFHYVCEVRYKAELSRHEGKAETEIERVALKVPLTPANAGQWLDLIWQLLLVDIPEPEKHPQLRKLGQHPSRVERAHFGERKTTRSIKDAVGENAKHQTDGYIRVAIKEALGKYLVRMLRREQSDKSDK
jgi:hypothetical protein